ELNGRANQVARALQRHGIGKGDAVTLMCGNRPEFAEVYAGCLRLGVRLTPINWHLTADEAAYIIENCGAKAMFADTRFTDAAAGAAAKSPGLSARIAIGGSID